MIRNRLNQWFGVLLTISVAAVQGVFGQPSTGIPFAVQDQAGLFSKEAKDQANADIAQIKKRFGKDLLIETIATAPKEIDKIDLKDAAAERKFFKDLAIERAKNAKVNGVYILICDDPKIHYVQPVVGEQTRKSGIFTDANLKVLGNNLRDNLKKNKPNDALTGAVGYVKKTMADQAPPPTSQPKKSGPAPTTTHAPEGPSWLGFLCFGIVIFLVIWLVIGLIRAFSGARSGAPGGYGYGGGGGGGGGGGFFPSLLGGLFGGMAGMWMYDHFFRGSSTTSADRGSPYSGSDYTSSPPPSDVGGEYSAEGGGEYEDRGAGGDFGGDDTGGGDFGGGGDLGGGDTGGGDFGGGGGGDTGAGEW